MPSLLETLRMSKTVGEPGLKVMLRIAESWNTMPY